MDITTPDAHAQSVTNRPNYDEDSQGFPVYQGRGLCRECEGRGEAEVYVGPVVNRSGGDLPYVPHHEARPCAECREAGYLTVARCAVCRRPASEDEGERVDEGACECDGDAIDDFLSKRARIDRYLRDLAAAREGVEGEGLGHMCPSIHGIGVGMAFHIAQAHDAKPRLRLEGECIYVAADIETYSERFRRVAIFSERARDVPEWEARDPAFGEYAKV